VRSAFSFTCELSLCQMCPSLFRRPAHDFFTVSFWSSSQLRASQDFYESPLSSWASLLFFSSTSTSSFSTGRRNVPTQGTSHNPDSNLFLGNRLTSGPRRDRSTMSLSAHIRGAAGVSTFRRASPSTFFSPAFGLPEQDHLNHRTHGDRVRPVSLSKYNARVSPPTVLPPNFSFVMCQSLSGWRYLFSHLCLPPSLPYSRPLK